MQPQRIEPRGDQESVWDYPRPPRIEPSDRHVQVFFAGRLIADTHRSLRVLETSHPPVYYIPLIDTHVELLSPSPRTTYCEYKGAARYYNLHLDGHVAEESAWYYPSPTEPYTALADHVAFYPGKVSACLVDGEVVQPQPGEFYGGWITSDIVGPFKGVEDSWGW